MPSILSVSHLSKAFETQGRIVKPVQDLSFELPAGKVLGVLGQSGCGKTTLLRLIAGLERPTSGIVSVSENTRIGIVFQEPRLLPWKTVRENIALALIHMPDGQKKEKAIDDVIALVRLAGADNAFPSELSGGMAQRVALARALVNAPDLLLLDEPFGALDALTRRLMQRELAKILSERHLSVILVTHDVGEAVLLSDQIFTLHEGRIKDSWTVPGDRPRVEDDSALVHLSTQILDSIIGQK